MWIKNRVFCKNIEKQKRGYFEKLTNPTQSIFSFAGLVRVGEAHSLGKSSGTGDVCLPSRPPDLPPQRFDPLLGGVASPNFQDMFIGCPGLCPSIFLVKLIICSSPRWIDRVPSIGVKGLTVARNGG